MKLGIVIELVLLAAGLCRGDDRPAFAVENRCPPAFVVTDKTGCYCGDSCKCKPGECPSGCPVTVKPTPDRPGACPCPDCGGTGKGGDHWSKEPQNPNAPCDYCGGKGWVLLDAGNSARNRPVAPSWFAAPFAHPRHPTPPGYPAAPKGYHWALYPGNVWGLVQDGLAPPKGYAAAPVPAPQQACPTGTCPLNRR